MKQRISWIEYAEGLPLFEFLYHTGITESMDKL